MRTRVLFCAAACVLQAHAAAAQVLTGALIGTVKDAQGGILRAAVVRVSSPALIGGPETLTTNEKGQLRFPAQPPGVYALDIEAQGFSLLTRMLTVEVGNTTTGNFAMSVGAAAVSQDKGDGKLEAPSTIDSAKLAITVSTRFSR